MYACHFCIYIFRYVHALMYGEREGDGGGGERETQPIGKSPFEVPKQLSAAIFLSWRVYVARVSHRHGCRCGEPWWPGIAYIQKSWPREEIQKGKMKKCQHFRFVNYNYTNYQLFFLPLKLQLENRLHHRHWWVHPTWDDDGWLYKPTMWGPQVPKL